MGKSFFNRLRSYFLKVGEVLRGEADAGSIFPNTSDIGLARELIYVEFLKQHTPSKCNVFLGGFLFGENGEESKQIDVIISTDTAPRYNFHNPDGKGKSFGPVEGCLGIASIKSMLDKNQLYDALEGIGSIPPTQPLGKRKNPLIKIENYEEWPYKIIYASDGLTSETILLHLKSFYELHSNIPTARRPDLIHVIGKYVIFKGKLGATIFDSENHETEPVRVDDYYVFKDNPDIQAFTWTLDQLQHNAIFSSHIIFNYSYIINEINEAK